jgi:TatD DNase family protein
MLIDTHCHIHESDYPLDKAEVITHANKAGVEKIICVGTNTEDSKLALDLALKHDGVFASIGMHPHYAKEGIGDLGRLVDSIYSGNGLKKLVAIGEIGLDYHYPDGPSPDLQAQLLKQQIELALEHDLPIIFHVRDAYNDFWKVLDEFKDKKIRGILHSFTDTTENLKEGLKRGFYISVNGISTFTHDKSQKAMFESIPLDKLLLETDAPWLTPYPLRGKIKINEPAFVKEVAEYISQTRHISFEEITDITTANAGKLFNL